MALIPTILGVGAAVTGATGAGKSIHGITEIKDARDTCKEAERIARDAECRFEKNKEKTEKKMDKLGVLELKIINSFETFADTIEKIQNRPQFANSTIKGVKIPKYNYEELEKVAINAGVLLDSLGGAAEGTAAGIAARGAARAMKVGTASTGAAISSLSGTAATNATLASLGGGALAAVGGTLLFGSYLEKKGEDMSEDANEALYQANKIKDEATEICDYLISLKDAAEDYIKTLNEVNKIYGFKMDELSYVVNEKHKINWNDFTEYEKILTENTVLLVGILYEMCNVNLLIRSDNEYELNKVNYRYIEEVKNRSKKVLSTL